MKRRAFLTRAMSGLGAACLADGSTLLAQTGKREAQFAQGVPSKAPEAQHSDAPPALPKTVTP